jgi:predicted outer membrane repeat protein
MKIINLVILFIGLFISVDSLASTTYYVNGTTGNNSYDGFAAAWDGTHGPKKTIQAGIDATITGWNYTVLIADGIYSGTGNTYLDFHGKSIRLLSQNGAEKTVIDCQNSGTAFMFYSGEGPDCLIEGFKIINSYCSMPVYFGRNKQLLYSNGGWPDWSLDNKIICESLGGNGPLIILDTDGSILNQIEKPQNINIWGIPRWSRDASKIVGHCYYNTISGVKCYPFTVNSDGTDFKFYASSDDWLVLRSVFSRDASHILFGSPFDALQLFNLTTETIQWTSSFSTQEGDYSPDGSKIITSLLGGGYAYVNPANGAITSTLLMGKILSNPSWSPDGDLLTFTSSGKICLCQLDGSSFTDITSSSFSDSGSRWSPDGKSLVYCEGNDIYIIDVLRIKGAAVNLQSSSPTFSKCIFKSNRSVNGGAIYAENSQALFSNCIVYENAAVEKGGAIYCKNSDITVVNCTISKNTSSHEGGGIYCENSSPLISNTIIWGNSPSQIMTQNGTPFIVYSDIEGGYEGYNNLDLNPNLTQGMYLCQDSPCIDFCYLGEQNDIDREMRPVDAPDKGYSGTRTYDIGADEFIDSDNDGLPDSWQSLYGSALLDLDNDDLNNLEEYQNSTNPANIDTDGDGLSDGEEVHNYHTNPLNPDSDDDNLNDKEEVLTYGTDPWDKDSDNDDLTDGEEVKTYLTIPTDIDTENDGMPDGWEVNHSLNPIVDDASLDPDLDGLNNLQEYDNSTLPHKADTDGDGLLDGEEVIIYHTDPLNIDPDNDGRSDRWETDWGSDPFDAMSPGIATIHVNAVGGSDAYNGRYSIYQGSKDGPKATIQAGVVFSKSQDTVLVWDGEYIGDGNRDIDIYNQAITVKSQNGPFASIIDCANSGRGFYLSSITGNGAIIEGFTIRNGNTIERGGGIQVSDAVVTIKNCIIRNNTAKSNGGGIIFRPNSNGSIVNCLLNNNFSGGDGGGIFIANSTVTIRNSTIAANNASNGGGGIGCDYGANVTIIDCILYSNNALNGKQLSVKATNYASVANVSFCNIDPLQGNVYVVSGATLNWGIGNMGNDPVFVRGPLEAYYLSQIAAGEIADSLCLNAGSDTAENLGLDLLTTRSDCLGDDGIVDMGYHSRYALWTYSITRSGSDITIRWNALPDTSYIVEWSEDMSSWNQVPVGQVSEYTDVNGGSNARKFYRVREE